MASICSLTVASPVRSLGAISGELAGAGAQVLGRSPISFSAAASPELVSFRLVSRCLSQARNWSLGQDVAPTNTNSAALDRERAREDRWKQGLLEYEALKRELSSMTVKVAVATGAYCLLVLSPEAMVSYGIGALASLAYLQLLYRHVDEVSEDNVPQIFVKRRQKRIGITSADLQVSFEKTIRGSSRALSSPRLVIPSALFGLWELSERFADNSPFHLQVAPLLFGFFAYKAAALVQTYEDNKDVLFMFSDPNGPEDT